MPLAIRLGIPETAGAIPTAARRLGAPVMVSAGALWAPDAERFRLPSARCSLLDMALDSSGFVRHASQGGYPWTVAQYVELAWKVGWAWWSQMDLPCEQQIAPNRAEVLSRVDPDSTDRYVFTNEQRSLGAKRGGLKTSTDRQHMRAIGARGGSVKRGSVRANNLPRQPRVDGCRAAIARCACSACRAVDSSL